MIPYHHRWDVNGPDELLEELGERANPKENTLEYYQLWLELLSRPEVKDKVRAKYLAKEIENFHASKPEIAALKPKFDSLFAASKPGPSR